MDVLAFECEWFDAQTKAVREFKLHHYIDGTLELVDLKTKRMFLKRVYCDLARERLFVGAVVNVFGKALELVRPGDERTKRYLVSETSTARAVCRLSSGALGGLVADLCGNFSCVRTLKSVRLGDLPEAEALESVPGELVLAIQVFDLTGTEAMSRLAAILERNAPWVAVPTIDPSLENPAQDDGTLCLIKPHAFAQSGDILAAIAEAGFVVTGMQTVTLDTLQAHRFFAAYRGVWPKYEDIVAHCIEGPCLALHVAAKVDEFRRLAGPTDAHIAKVLRPASLRATFGLDAVKNALHCTDMAEDATLELHYFFHLLATGGA